MHTLQRIERDILLPLQACIQQDEGNAWEHVWRCQTTYTDYAQRYQRTQMKIEILHRLGLNLDRKKVLDIGCGDGTTLKCLAKQYNCTGTGIDISPSAIKLAKKRNSFDGVYYRIADGRDIPLVAGTYDLVLSWGVLEHADNFALSIAESFRMLRPGGKLALVQPHAWSFGVIQEAFLRFFGQWKYGRQINFTRPRLIQLMKQHGFQETIYAVRPATRDLPLVHMVDKCVHGIWPEWGHYLYVLATK